MICGPQQLVGQEGARVVIDFVANMQLHVCEFVDKSHPTFFSVQHPKNHTRAIRKRGAIPPRVKCHEQRFDNLSFVDLHVP
jgi:hypothetical protein